MAVTLGKCHPNFGSTPQNTLAVPQRWYSPWRRTTHPCLKASGGQICESGTNGFSSTQSTGSCSENGFSYTASTSSMRWIYSSSSSATHYIF